MTQGGPQRARGSAVTTEEAPGSNIGQACQRVAIREHREQMAEKYLPLVRRPAWKFRHSGEPLEDLVQIGTEGLLKAIDKFDPTRGVKFESYAVPVIVG